MKQSQKSALFSLYEAIRSESSRSQPIYESD